MEAPRVTFYVLPEADERARLVFACRLAEKAWLHDHRVLVRLDSPGEAEAFDDLLWTFADGSFVPHEPAATSDRLAPVLVCGGEPDRDADLLINLGSEVPAGWDRFARVAEVLDGDPGRRQQGRERFRFYRERGSEPETHNLGAAG